MDWAYQNDCQNFSFVKYTGAVVEKMTRNSFKMPNSKGCQIRFRSEFIRTIESFSENITHEVYYEPWTINVQKMI